MNCKICGKKVILIPSAAERAKKDVTGKPASYYTALFTTHAKCELEKRAEGVRDLMRRLKENENASR